MSKRKEPDPGFKAPVLKGNCPYCREGFVLQAQSETVFPWLPCFVGKIGFVCHECGKRFYLQIAPITHTEDAYESYQIGIENGEVVVKTDGSKE